MNGLQRDCGARMLSKFGECFYFARALKHESMPVFSGLPSVIHRIMLLTHRHVLAYYTFYLTVNKVTSLYCTTMTYALIAKLCISLLFFSTFSKRSSFLPHLVFLFASIFSLYFLSTTVAVFTAHIFLYLCSTTSSCASCERFLTPTYYPSTG